MKKMSKTTSSLKKRVTKMLKSRGSMTVKEVDFLNEVLRCLEEDAKLEKEQRVQNGMTIVGLLIRFLLNPDISERVSHFISHLIDRLS